MPKWHIRHYMLDLSDFYRSGKISNAGVLVSYNLSEENKDNWSIKDNLLFQGRHRSYMTKGTGFLQMNHHELLRRRVYIPKRYFCVFGSIFAFTLKCWNLVKLLMQSFIMNNCLQKRPHSAMGQCKTTLRKTITEKNE